VYGEGKLNERWWDLWKVPVYEHAGHSVYLDRSGDRMLLLGDVARAKRETSFVFDLVFCKGHLPEMDGIRSQPHIDQKVVKTVFAPTCCRYSKGGSRKGAREVARTTTDMESGMC
jgi:hypothetical protein